LNSKPDSAQVSKLQWRAEGMRTVRRPWASSLGASNGPVFVKM